MSRRYSHDTLALHSTELADEVWACSKCSHGDRSSALCNEHYAQATRLGLSSRLPQTHISASELGDWRQCRFKHHLGWVERWRQPVDSKPLANGTGWHNVLEAHYKEDWDALAEALGDGELIQEGLLAGQPVEGSADGSILRWMFEGYLEQWGAVENEPFDVIAVEEEWMIDLPKNRGKVKQVKMKIDLVIEDDIGFMVVDHKSGAQPPKVHMGHDSQFLLYAWGARERGYDVRRVMRNFSKTKKLKRDMTLEERHNREVMALSPGHMRTVIDELMADLNVMRVARPSRSPDADCSWKCSYRDACLGSYSKPKRLLPLLENAGLVQERKEPEPSKDDDDE